MQIFTVKELRGQSSVVKVNFSHPVMQQHIPLRTSEPQAPVSTAGSPKSKDAVAKPVAPKTPGGQLTPYTAYQATSASKEFLASGGAHVDELLSSAKVSEALASAFKKLQRRLAPENFPVMGGDGKEMDVDDSKEEARPWYELVKMEQGLMNIVLTKAERQAVKTGAEMPRLDNGEIVRRFINGGMKVVTLLLGPKDDFEAILANPSEGCVIEADAKVIVSIQKTKRFTRTRVAGIHLFTNIDPKHLAEKLQKACAASASVIELDEIKGKAKPYGVIVQGSVVTEVCEVLEKVYGLPKAMITVSH